MAEPWGELPFRVYLVGGAVRDRLLGRPVKERDFVVVGATPEQMEALGFQRVGREFPVFLHPKTKEEYALARTERKRGRGYKGFVVHASPEVTLEEDLRRRDLTINAMAMDREGRVIDPYGGLADLRARRLRHVSEAFVEDPLRVLRVARFAARFAPLGFEIASETLVLMREIVARGEMEALTPERVWMELTKALAEPRPSLFFLSLRRCGALERLFPEIDRLFGVPQPPRYHPEIDTGLHAMMAVDMAARLGADLETRFATLTHDLGKGLTPREMWPRHLGHEERGLAPLEALCERYRAPGSYRRLARKVCRYHTHCHRLFELTPAKLVETLYGLDALRKDDRDFERFLLACEADARGRKGLTEQPYPQAQAFREVREIALSVKGRDLLEKGLKGAQLGEALKRLRIERVAALWPEIKRRYGKDQV